MPRCPTCGEDAPREAARCPACGAALFPSDPGARRVSVLVLDLVGPDGSRVGDSEQGEANVEPAVARTRRELRLLAGTLQPSKVHTAVGVFGGPPVGGDGAERAVRAALRIAAAPAEPGEPPAVAGDAAVHTGVYPPSADPPAGDRKLVPPEAAQVAARLLGNSAPGVVVDRPTHDETRHLFEYEPLDGPSPAWVARAARGSYGIDLELGLPTPFTGRDHELALLTDIYARVLMESSPHLVTVVGEAGAGKSRLLSEFLSALDSRPELVYWRQGRSLAGALGRGGGVTLWALGEVVKGQAGILESDDLRTAREKVDVATRNLLPDPGERDRVGPLLDPLVGLVGPDPAPVPRRVAAVPRGDGGDPHAGARVRGSPPRGPRHARLPPPHRGARLRRSSADDLHGPVRADGTRPHVGRRHGGGSALDDHHAGTAAGAGCPGADRGDGRPGGGRRDPAGGAPGGGRRQPPVPGDVPRAAGGPVDGWSRATAAATHVRRPDVGPARCAGQAAARADRGRRGRRQGVLAGSRGGDRRPRRGGGGDRAGRARPPQRGPLFPPVLGGRPDRARLLAPGPARRGRRAHGPCSPRRRAPGGAGLGDVHDRRPGGRPRGDPGEPRGRRARHGPGREPGPGAPVPATGRRPRRRPRSVARGRAASTRVSGARRAAGPRERDGL